MTRAEAAIILLFPLVVWAVSFIILLIQVGLLYVIETRITVGILDNNLGSHIVAVCGMALLWNYDRKIAAPIISSLYPKDMRTTAFNSTLAILAALSIASLVTVFHYSMNVTGFKGRSRLVFPKPVYNSNPRAVRQLWIMLFNLVNVTSCCYMALSPVLLYLSTSAFHGDRIKASDILLFAGLGMAWLIATCARSLILGYPSQATLLAKINYLVAVNSMPTERRIRYSKDKSDPFGWGRYEARKVVSLLERMADRFDSSMNFAAPHPIATIYRAAAGRIGQHCTSLESLDGKFPLSILAVLVSIESITISDSPQWRNYLLRHLDISDNGDSTQVSKTILGTSRFSRIMSTSGKSLNQVNGFVQGSWQAIVIVVATIALMFGKINLDSFIGVGGR